MSSNVLGDSSAVLDTARVLVQHQVALAFIRERAQNPRTADVRWLDLACGRGQILTNFEHVLSEARRKKIAYLGFDAVLDYVRQTKQRAEALFERVRVEICSLSKFELYLDCREAFDVITFTNSAHEMSPEDLAQILVIALCRLADHGLMYLYDMERLPELELGAIPWEAEEIQQIFDAVLRAAGIEHELPEVAMWPHTSCTCWHFQIHRDHLDISPESLLARRDDMTVAAAIAIRSVLERKLFSTHSALQVAASHGAQGPSELKEVNRLLHDFWAISRALGRPLELQVLS